MLDCKISADQVRSIAGVTFAEAQTACYFVSARNSGWSMQTLCEKTGLRSKDARNYAYRFGIAFSDYDPLAKPKVLEWHKVKGGWELRNKTDVIGFCGLTENRKDYGNQYEATGPGGVFERCWTARVAMTRVSAMLDGLSPELFGGKPIKVKLIGSDGRRETLFPDDSGAVENCRKAFLSEVA